MNEKVFIEFLGHMVGKNIAQLVNERKEELFEFRTTPYFWTTHFGKSIRSSGFAVTYQEIIIRGDLEALSFIAYYFSKVDITSLVSQNPGNSSLFLFSRFLDKGKLQTVTSMGQDPAVSKAAQLFRYDCIPSLDDIRNGKVNLNPCFH